MIYTCLIAMGPPQVLCLLFLVGGGVVGREKEIMTTEEYSRKVISHVQKMQLKGFRSTISVYNITPNVESLNCLYSLAF
uniref:Uncharacterized protein n=1 Tax=Arundo donax TaxID=35708 RepID=A0A0A9RYS8_ARUDO